MFLLFLANLTLFCLADKFRQEDIILKHVKELRSGERTLLVCPSGLSCLGCLAKIVYFSDQMEYGMAFFDWGKDMINFEIMNEGFDVIDDCLNGCIGNEYLLSEVFFEDEEDYYQTPSGAAQFCNIYCVIQFQPDFDCVFEDHKSDMESDPTVINDEVLEPEHKLELRWEFRTKFSFDIIPLAVVAFFCMPEFWSALYVIFAMETKLRLSFEKFNSFLMSWDYLTSLVPYLVVLGIVLVFLVCDSEGIKLFRNLSTLFFFSWRVFLPQYGIKKVMLFIAFSIVSIVGSVSMSIPALNTVWIWVERFMAEATTLDMFIFASPSFASSLCFLGYAIVLETMIETFNFTAPVAAVFKLFPGRISFLFSIRRYDESLSRYYRRPSSNGGIRRRNDVFLNKRYSLHFISTAGYIFGEVFHLIVKYKCLEAGQCMDELKFPFSCRECYCSFFILCFLFSYCYYLGIVKELVKFSLPQEERELPFTLSCIICYIWYEFVGFGSQVEENEDEEDIYNDDKKKKKKMKIRTCENCKKKSDGRKKWRKCARCKIVFYCSLDCQRDHWGIHKEICNEIEMLRRENNLIRTKCQMLLDESMSL